MWQRDTVPGVKHVMNTNNQLYHAADAHVINTRNHLCLVFTNLPLPGVRIFAFGYRLTVSVELYEKQTDTSTQR